MSELLGHKVRDLVTGFEGVAISYITYITGCSQYGILPELNGGKYPDTTYIDYQRLVAVGEDPIVVPSSDTGADFMQDAPR